MGKEDKILEASIIKSLRKNGFILPLEDDEFLYYVKEYMKDDIPNFPSEFNDPHEIIKNGYLTVSFPTESNNETTDLMSMAAREGKEIPKEILDKMHKDRNNLEKE